MFSGTRSSVMTALFHRVSRVLALSAIWFACSVNAETFIVQGTEELPVPVEWVVKAWRARGLSPARLQEQLGDRKLFHSREVITSEAQREMVFTIYITRDGHIRMECPSLKYGESCSFESKASVEEVPETPSMQQERAECSMKGGTWDRTARRPNGYCILDTEDKCISRGGIWGRICLAQSLACVKKFSDGGKACSDSRDCEGKRCIDIGNKPNDHGTTIGECVRTSDPCGGFTFIDNGKPGPTINYDYTCTSPLLRLTRRSTSLLSVAGRCAIKPRSAG